MNSSATPELECGRSPRRIVDRNNSFLEDWSDEVRVGEEYQAKVDPYVEPLVPYEREYEECLWKPCDKDDESAVDGFVRFFAKTEGLREDALLYILYRCGYSFELACVKARNKVHRTRKKIDMFIMKSAFQQQGRRFDLNKMKKLLPHLSMADIVEHYYFMKSLGKRSLYKIDPINLNFSHKINGIKKDNKVVTKKNGFLSQKLSTVVEDAEENDAVYPKFLYLNGYKGFRYGQPALCDESDKGSQVSYGGGFPFFSSLF